MQKVNSIEEKVNNLEQKQYVREEIVHPSLESLIFSYNLCDFTSNTESYFNTHMKENHEEKPDNTVETTIIEIDNEKNKQEKTPSENKCDVSDFKTDSKQGLKIHKTKKHTNKPRKCPLCNLQSETYEQ